MNNDFRKEQGDRIRKARLQRFRGSVNMKEMAIFLRVPYRTYQNWEMGRNLPRKQMLLKLANLLKVSPAYLYFGSETE
jgi:transcriptional regulator with XRE-family HTH domain